MYSNFLRFCGGQREKYIYVYIHLIPAIYIREKNKIESGKEMLITRLVNNEIVSGGINLHTGIWL